MTLFGYQICTAKYSPKAQDDLWLIPLFGFSYWTFNNPVYKSREMGTPIVRPRPKRIIIAREKGLYIHVWLFSYRFDLDFRKIIEERG